MAGAFHRRNLMSSSFHFQRFNIASTVSIFLLLLTLTIRVFYFLWPTLHALLRAPLHLLQKDVQAHAHAAASLQPYISACIPFSSHSTENMSTGEHFASSDSESMSDSTSVGARTPESTPPQSVGARTPESTPPQSVGARTPESTPPQSESDCSDSESSSLTEDVGDSSSSNELELPTTPSPSEDDYDNESFFPTWDQSTQTNPYSVYDLWTQNLPTRNLTTNQSSQFVTFNQSTQTTQTPSPYELLQDQDLLFR